MDRSWLCSVCLSASAVSLVRQANKFSTPERNNCWFLCRFCQNSKLLLQHVGWLLMFSFRPERFSGCETCAVCVCWFDLFITLTLMWFLSVKPETSIPPKQLKKGWYAMLVQHLCSSPSTAPPSVASWHPPVLPIYPAPSWWSKPNFMLFVQLHLFWLHGTASPLPLLLLKVKGHLKAARAARSFISVKGCLLYADVGMTHGPAGLILYQSLTLLPHF